MIDVALIEEIVTKECERYDLEKSGFVGNRMEEVSLLAASPRAECEIDCSLEEFKAWKERLLCEWYVRKDFAHFFNQRIGERGTCLMVKRLAKNFVAYLRRNGKVETVDHELKLAPGKTVAYKLSSALFAEMYPKLYDAQRLFASPEEMEEHCSVYARALFPLNYNTLFEQLLLKDNEFWVEMWELIRRFVHCLTIGRRGAAVDETVNEVSMEAAFSFQQQLEHGKLERVASASHLLHSLQMTCRYKFREYLRQSEKRQEEELFEEADWQLLEQTMSPLSVIEHADLDGQFSYLLEMDEGDEYAVCCALVDVLSCGRGKVYEALTEGMEEAARILIMLYLEDRKYEDISLSLYGSTDVKQLVRLRKSVSRGKDYLKKKMAKLIVTYKKKNAVPLGSLEER